MTIVLEQAGKRYNLHWIFRRLSFMFEAGRSYSITGPNGSGKSTLMAVLAGQIQPQEGRMLAGVDGKLMPPDEKWFRQYSIAAPYLELIEELTLAEAIDYHVRLKPILPGISPTQLPEILGLAAVRNRQIRYFSSGMKQKVKLGLAIFSDTPLLLLDEPGSNLDAVAFALYQQWLQDYTHNRTVIICSNNPAETGHCTAGIFLPDYKPDPKH